MRNFNIFKPDFVGVKDNLLTKEECREAIRWTKTHKILQEDRQKEQSGYSYCDLMDRGESIGRCFSPKPLRPIERGLRLLVDSYVEKYPEVQMVESWDIDYVRFKWWKPGDYYSIWHSEHGTGDTSYRILSFLLYLSDNDAYTEFKRHRNVRSKAGRGIIFPAYFTHQHRGSICKKGLDRFIVSGYFSFL